MSRRRFATIIIVSETSGSCSQSRTRRLLRVVRMPRPCSTRQRSGIGTKPRHGCGREATVKVAPCRAASPISLFGGQPATCERASSGSRPCLSCRLAVVTSATRRNPAEHIRTWRLRPTVDLLAAIPPAFSLLRAAAHALGVDGAGPGLGAPTDGGTRRRRQRAGGTVPHPLAAEAVPPPADG